MLFIVFDFVNFVLVLKNFALSENDCPTHKSADLDHPSEKILVYPELNYLDALYAGIQNNPKIFLLEVAPEYILLYFYHILAKLLI